jgi:flagellar motor switch protein FliM
MERKTAAETRVQEIDAIGTPLLRSLHASLAEKFAKSLSAMLRCDVEAHLSGVDSISYGQFVQTLETPSCFHVLKAEPLTDCLLLDIETAILYPMLDRMLGGTGEDEPPRRAPSDIELPLVARISKLFLDELRRAWHCILDMKFEVQQVESHPRFLRILPSGEPVVVVGFELKIETASCLMRLCLPARAIQQIGEHRAASGDSAAIEAMIEGDGPIDVTVTLAETTLSAAELRSLRAGDIIVTETDADGPLSVAIGQGPHFLAKPGACRGHKAVLLSEKKES